MPFHALDSIDTILATATRLGVDLSPDWATLDTSGLDFVVVHARDSDGTRWIVRAPRRADALAGAAAGATGWPRPGSRARRRCGNCRPDPRPLGALRKAMCGKQAPPGLADTFELLSARWRAEHSSDSFESRGRRSAMYHARRPG